MLVCYPKHPLGPGRALHTIMGRACVECGTPADVAESHNRQSREAARSPRRRPGFTETYRDPRSYAQNILAYRPQPDGSVVVSHYPHAGEDVGPNHYREASAEAARATLDRLRRLVKARGYTEFVR